MDYLIDERFKQVEQRLDKIEQQQTEPIQITVERKYPDRDVLQNLSRSQDEHTKLLIEHSRGINMVQTSIDHLTAEMNGARADIMSIKATQSDHGELLREHGQALAEINATMATKEEIVEIKATQSDHGELLREHGQALAEIMATQDKILQLLQKSAE